MPIYKYLQLNNNMKKITTILLLLLISHLSFAQFGNIWALPINKGIDFNGAGLTCRSSIHYGNSSTSVCDGNGQLLFYSDNLTFRNKYDSIMPNSTNLDWVNTSTVYVNQGVIAVPDPANLNRYYSFNLSIENNSAAGNSKMYYNIIDMTLDSGLGDLLLKNQYIDGNFVEKVAATRHCNGRDWWIVTHKCTSDAYYSYLLDINGFNPIPVISHSGLFYRDTVIASNISGSYELIDYEYEGALKISPNGKYVAMSNLLNVEVLSFDNQNGSISNSLFVDSGGVNTNDVLARYYYACTFSPNSKFLYAGLSEARDSSLYYDSNIYQYDLQLNDSSEILLSKTPILVNDSITKEFNSLQLGPDNKIYSYSTVDAFPQPFSYLYEISQPDQHGLQCNFHLSQLQCNSLERTWLPSFPDAIFTNHHKASLRIPTCIAGEFDSIPFYDSLLTTTRDYLWNFGDPASGVNNTFNGQFPVHAFSSPGTYTVTLTLPSDCNPITITQQVIANPTSAITPIITLNSFYLESTPALQYQWYLNNNIIAGATSQSYTPTANGDYTVTITDSNNCTQTSAVFNLTNVGLRTNNNPLNFSIYPNPANQVIQINNPTQKQTTFTITDLVGNVIIRTNINKVTESINIASLSNGIYLITIDDIFNQKLVVNH
jgi:hypothetical protein